MIILLRCGRRKEIWSVLNLFGLAALRWRKVSPMWILDTVDVDLAVEVFGTADCWGISVGFVVDFAAVAADC